jgi:FlaG/FlaF family flagellin (archaellin)
MPSKEAAQLQHSCEFVEEEDATVVRQTTVATGDSYISRRAAHSDFNVTENDVKVNGMNRSGRAAKLGQQAHPAWVLTPDSGISVLLIRSIFCSIC